MGVRLIGFGLDGRLLGWWVVAVGCSWFVCTGWSGNISAIAASPQRAVWPGGIDAELGLSRSL
jgi:hypothetical protein